MTMGQLTPLVKASTGQKICSPSTRIRASTARATEVKRTVSISFRALSTGISGQ